MVGEAVVGLQIFTQLFNTAKGLMDIHDATTRDGAILMIQRGVLEAQAQQMALVEEVNDLKKQVASFETWDTEKERYDLVDLRTGVGVLAYRIKPAMQGSEPDHCICASCYQGRVKSVLQMEYWQPMRCKVLVCHVCGAYLYVEGQSDPGHASLKPKAGAA